MIEQEMNSLEELKQKVTLKLYNESDNKYKFSQEFFDKVFSKNKSKEIDSETYIKIKKALSLEYKKIIAIFLNTWKRQLKIIFNCIYDKDLCKKEKFTFEKFFHYNKPKIFFRQINAVLSRLDYVANLDYEIQKDKYFSKYVENPKYSKHFKKMTIFYEGRTHLSLLINEECFRWKKDENGNPIGTDIADFKREENFGFDEALKKLNAFDDGNSWDNETFTHIEDYATMNFVIAILKNICEKINTLLPPILKENGKIAFNLYNPGEGNPEIMLGYQVNFKTKVDKNQKISTEALDLAKFMKFANQHNSDELAKVKKSKSYKCPICKKVKYEFPKLLYNHVLKEHSDKIPENMPVEQYVFNIKNKKIGGKCVICGKPTEWNTKTNKYHRICSEECKKKYIEEARKRLMKTYGTDDLSKDPDHQKKMLDNRKISKPYKFQDGKEIIANSSYEYDFLRFMEQDLGYTSEEIQPCNITFNYEFEGKSHFYIPDFYLPDFNLIVEVKDEGSKANFIPRMRLMDLEKYKKIIEVGKYNFITVVGKDYSKLIEVLDYLKNIDYTNDENKTLIIEIDKKNYGNLAVPKEYKLKQAIKIYNSFKPEIAVEDITDIISTIDEIYKKE